MIYTRIDTFSAILYDVSVRKVLEHLDLPIDNIDDLYKNAYKSSQVQLGDTFVFLYKGIRLECKYKDYIDASENHSDISIFDVVFNWLRLYIGGEGVTFLENLHSDVEGYSLQTLLCDPEYYSALTPEFKITRCDFAFDYVNYEGNHFEKLRKILLSAEFDDNLSDNGRLYTGTKSGITYSVHAGKDKTIYLGNTSSDRMLRIYDKKYQLCNKEGIWDLSNVPQTVVDNEPNIQSWYRIELQCRDDWAFRYLFSCGGDFRYIMGEIANHFDVRKKDGKLISPLHNIFEWGKHTPIIQNAKSVKPITELEALKIYIGRIPLRKIHELMCILGAEGFKKFINSCIENRSKGNKDARDRYISAFNNEISLILKTENIDINSDKFHAYLESDGMYYLC